jgi:hypothetical protein
MDENFVSVNWMSPDYWEIQDTRGTFHGTDGNFKDASVRLVQEKDGGVTVRVQASCPLSAVRLRWNCEDLIRGKKIFGDAWERGYGDMEWGGVSAARILPWYFLILSEKEKKVLGIGVKVTPVCLLFLAGGHIRHQSVHGCALRRRGCGFRRPDAFRVHDRLKRICGSFGSGGREKILPDDVPGSDSARHPLCTAAITGIMHTETARRRQFCRTQNSWHS